jgi:hypothetical protein
MKRLTSGILAVLIIFSSSAPVFAQEEAIPRCRDAIDSSLRSYVYGTLSEDATKDVELSDLGFLNKIQSLYSTDNPTSGLIQQALIYLRETNTEMEKNCSVLRNNLRIPIGLAYERRIIECADRDFTVDQSLNLSLYCGKQKTFYLDLVKDHVRSITIRDAQQKQASKIVKKYQELNKKLEGLSEAFVRMAQYITKFNAALGKIITGTCQQ